jgi:predicted small secreted protein
MKKSIVVLAIALTLSACSTTKTAGDITNEGVKLTQDFGKVEITYSTFGDWQSIKATASSNVPIEHDAGLEQAMNVATMRAKRNIVEFINTDLKSKKTTDTLTDSLVKHDTDNKEYANKIATKITESITVEANGIIRGTYIVDRKVSGDGKNVTVVVMVDKKSMAVASQLRTAFSK